MQTLMDNRELKEAALRLEYITRAGTLAYGRLQRAHDVQVDKVKQLFMEMSGKMDPATRENIQSMALAALDRQFDDAKAQANRDIEAMFGSAGDE